VRPKGHSFFVAHYVTLEDDMQTKNAKLAAWHNVPKEKR
jgi:hypothetical protein